MPPIDTAVGDSDSVDRMLSGARAAVVVVDVQHDFTRRDGVLGIEGRDVDRCRKIVQPINDFLSTARGHGIPIVFTQMLGDPRSTSEAWSLVGAANARGDRVVCEVESWGAELDSELAIRPGDHVVTKHRASAFIDTDLEKILKELGCDTILVCGLTAEVCVESTARHAFMLDYHVVLLDDLISSLDADAEEHALSILQRHFAHIRSSSDLKSIWKQGIHPIEHERKN